MYDDIEKNIKEYKKSKLLGNKYYFLLDDIRTFINVHEIDISSVNKLTINKINKHCRIRSLTKTYFSKPEDEENNETNDEYEENSNHEENNETNDEYEENSEKNSNYEEYNETNDLQSTTICHDNYEDDYINELRNVLLKAMEDNDRELMICTMNYLNTLESNKKNMVTNKKSNVNIITNECKAEPTAGASPSGGTYFKAPKWIEPLKCTINPENNKKLGNKSFNYAIAASKTSGKNRIRLTNIEKFINDSDFKGINYPLAKKDYETFENNNLSIKLTVFKIIENEKKLIIYYNQMENNGRENKTDLILFGNNHYSYITKYSSLSTYVKYN